MKKRIAGLLYVGGVLGSLLMGAEALMAEPSTAVQAREHTCWICDEYGECVRMRCWNRS